MYEIDKKTKGKIINALRRLTYSYPPRNEVKRLRKIDKALYSCELCNTYCYEGKSDKTYVEYTVKYSNNKVLKERPQVDHTSPVIPIIKGWQWNWNDVINNMFCGIEGLKCLCPECHSTKTTQEQETRTILRRASKLPLVD